MARSPGHGLGYYLLFVIDSSGRPSTGRFIQICPGTGRHKPVSDRDWWQQLRDRLEQGHDLDEAELRQIRRDLVGPSDPPGRHGPGHAPDRDHDHGQDHGQDIGGDPGHGH